MPKPASTRSAYKMLTCIYLCRTLLFFAPYADFFKIKVIGSPGALSFRGFFVCVVSQKLYLQEIKLDIL